MTAPRHPLRRLARALGLFLVLPVGLALLPLAACQGRLIYPAPRYPAGTLAHLPPGVEPLRYRTGEGEQVSFYRPPPAGGAPLRLWLLCGGNGATALAWCDLLDALPDAAAGVLLLDYPGYGANPGSCTPGRILDASEAAVAALARRLGLPRAALDARLGVAGQSLGAAAALQYAARHPVRRIVLAAPFTSMVEMGHRVLCWPCGQLIWHRFDNRARLDEALAHMPPPPVLILHGDGDRLIPIAMGRELADAHPGRVAFRAVPGAVPGAGHDAVAVDLVAALAEDAEPMRPAPGIR